ncbi:MAG: DUF624 domain-containing protein [Erysipelotrichaceae bacterium]|nr:DUF624 domain-containing protein [Erysipelotrichaceae bacterium]
MNYNNPFIKMLETIANMLIATFFWFIFSLPVITIIPSSAALYHTINKVVFGPKKGNGVFKDFFDSYKLNLIPGIKLSIITIIALLFVAEGLWTGYQIYKLSIWGMLYMILGCVISPVVITTIIYIPPVLSRFIAPVLSIIRLSVYFAMKKPLRSILYFILLVFMVLAIYAFPLAVVIVPAVYTDFVRTYLEKDFNKFIEENDLESLKLEEAEEEEMIEDEGSVSDLEEKFSKERKRK